MSETLDMVKKSLEKQKAMEAEIVRLKNELNKTQEELAEAHNQIRTLDAKYDRLKLAKAYGWNEEQKRKATARINKMVREIESCISLLKKLD